MSSSRRESAKKGGSSSWKERLRSQCFQRLRQERQRILWAARGDQSSVKGALQLLISDVSGSLGQPPTEAGFPGTPASVCPSLQASSTPAAAAAAPEEVFQLEGEEYEELMRALEASLLEEQLQEEAAYLERLEQQEMDEVVDAYYAHHRPADQQQQQQQQQQEQQQQPQQQPEPGPSGEPGVLCPLCGQAYLVQHRGVILCPQRDLRLDVGLEGLQLEDLRQRLAQALQVHAQSGCLGQPGFIAPPQQQQQQQQQEGAHGGAAAVGGGMLWMACQHCGCLEVVL